MTPDTTKDLLDVAIVLARDVLTLAALHVPEDPAEAIVLAGVVERANATLARLEPLRHQLAR